MCGRSGLMTRGRGNACCVGKVATVPLFQSLVLRLRDRRVFHVVGNS
jgi:hypothetical protein